MLQRALIGLAGAVVIGFPYAFAAQAASFDCTAADSFAEITICAHSDLNYLDEELAVLYRSLIDRLPSREAARVRRDQRSWLTARDSCGEDARCLRARYQERIARLREYEETD